MMQLVDDIERTTDELIQGIRDGHKEGGPLKRDTTTPQATPVFRLGMTLGRIIHFLDQK